MYIRWVHRRHKNETSRNLIFHDAYLVENYRNHQGHPRQRVICFLGNLREFDGEVPLSEWELFLSRAERILAEQAIQTQIDRDHILSRLEQYGPTCTPDDITELLCAQVESFCHWWERYGQGCPYQEIARVMSRLHPQEQSRTA